MIRRLIFPAVSENMSFSLVASEPFRQLLKTYYDATAETPADVRPLFAFPCPFSSAIHPHSCWPRSPRPSGRLPSASLLVILLIYLPVGPFPEKSPQAVPCPALGLRCCIQPSCGRRVCFDRSTLKVVGLRYSRYVSVGLGRRRHTSAYRLKCHSSA